MTGNSRIRRVGPGATGSQFIEIAARIIRGGGLAIYPTRSLYGLGADAMCPETVARVFQVKQRSAANPISVLIPDQSHLSRLAADIPEAARYLMRRLWPGSVTIVFYAEPWLPATLTAGTSKIGIRIPEHPVAKALVEAVDAPITATSANLAGRPGCHRIDDLPEQLADAVDILLDAGELEPGIGSTVVDVTSDPPMILREGTVSSAAIKQILEKFNIPVCVRQK